MWQKISIALVAVTLAYTRIKKFTDKWSKILEPLTLKAEEMAKDGTITAQERKELVKNAIDIITKEQGWKLNFIERMALNMMIDYIAKKLPTKNININDVIIKAKNGSNTP